MLIGRFYFIRTINGNLIGEFSNNSSLAQSTESADLISPNSGDFIGTYNTTWQEEGTGLLSNLVIGAKPNSINLLTLVWRINGREAYWGEGFIVNGLLIGDYRDRSVIPRN